MFQWQRHWNTPYIKLFFFDLHADGSFAGVIQANHQAGAAIHLYRSGGVRAPLYLGRGQDLDFILEAQSAGAAGQCLSAIVQEWE